MSNLTALVGAVVFAWLPEDEAPHHPGPKFRPVLVVDMDLERKQLCVAYGTSQRVDRCGRGEIVFTPKEIEKLSKPTKFCLGKAKWIPLSSSYLSKTGEGKNVAYLGRTPANRAADLLKRLEEVGYAYA
ncbi:hypothetical protein [Modicisalibacter sp. MOD 31.J]|uniref:hypothetical protein n=1 Tax=Modicisalibacter sp. MOD 31.J TaxID=2831897 RepID=UPI001CCAE4DC|nr:hypothetical protein [Modicisalibacter sp. MOD 31.J]MBZ9574527.1 hypothetical protein [Modicisalibacter sp. MOD 31.J]